MSKKYGLDVQRIRVDLGDDVFVDSDTPTATLFDSDSVKGVLARINKFGGEIVEQNGNFITFDTKNLTIYGEIVEVDE